MAKQQVTSDATDPIKDLLGQFTVNLTSLKGLDANATPFGKEIYHAFTLLNQILPGIDGLLDDQSQGLNDLQDLKKKVEDILKKIEGIDFSTLTPDAILQLVTDALSDWKKHIQDQIDQNTSDLTGHETRIHDLEEKVGKLDPDQLVNEVKASLSVWITNINNQLSSFESDITIIKAELAALGVRIDNLPDIETIKNAVLAVLNPWQISIEKRLSDLEAEEGGEESILAGFRQEILDLKNKINSLQLGLPEDQVKALIQAALTQFQVGIDLKINALQTQLTAFNTLLGTLSQKVDALADLGPRLTAVEDKLKNLPVFLDPEQLKQWVLGIIQSWKDDITIQISNLDAKLTADRKDIDQLIIDVQALIVKVNGLVIPSTNDIVAAVLLALSTWKSTIDQYILDINTKQQSTETNISVLQIAITTIQNFITGPLPDNWKTDIITIINNLIGPINVNIQQLQSDKTVLETALVDLTTELHALQAEVAALPKCLTKLEIEALIQISITTLQTALELQITAINVSINSLTQTTVNIQTNITNLTQTVSVHTDQLVIIQNQIIDIKNIIALLPPVPTVSEITAQVILALSTWKTEINTDIKDLKECCVKVQELISAIEIQLAAIQKAIEESEASEVGIRLARVCLEGWGVVGGLETKSDENCVINLTKGLGITPNGILVIEPNDRVFSYYRKYSGPAGDDALLQYSLWELLEWEQLGIKPGDPMPADVFPTTPQTNEDLGDPFIAHKIVLLVPLEDCRRLYLLIERDDLLQYLGKAQTLKKLLGAHEESDFIFSESFSPDDNVPSEDDLYRACNPSYTLPEIPLFRFGFRPPDECDPDDLDETNFPAICSLENLYQTWLPIIQEAYTRVDKAMTKVTALYHPLLFPQLNIAGFKKKQDLLFKKWTVFKKYNDTVTPNKTAKFYIQYFYDWARDLIASYHELRLELQVLMAEICALTPQMLAMRRGFLMLGPAARPDQDGLAAPLRDEFHQPPIYNGNAARFETCRLYYRRYFELLEGFFLPGYDKTLPGWCKCHDDEPDWEPDYSRLRVTPSRQYIWPLSKQSIPFYYPLAQFKESVHFYWDYHRSKTRTVDRHLSYHASDDPDSYSAWPEVIRPLYYTFDAFDFYRVEGFIGKSHIKVQKDVGPVPVIDAIRYLIQKHNLDFDLLEIQILCKGSPKGPESNLHQQYILHEGTTNNIYLSFLEKILGAEHLAGTPKGGTLIVITTQMELGNSPQLVAIADFSIPYRCCGALSDITSKLNEHYTLIIANQTDISKNKTEIDKQAKNLNNLEIDVTKLEGIVTDNKNDQDTANVQLENGIKTVSNGLKDHIVKTDVHGIPEMQSMISDLTTKTDVDSTKIDALTLEVKTLDTQLQNHNADKAAHKPTPAPSKGGIEDIWKAIIALQPKQ